MSRHDVTNEEKALARLLAAASSWKGRTSQYKRDGGLVAGTVCPYVPVEVVHAAGMFACRVIGTPEGDVLNALPHRPSTSCPYGTGVLESVLSGELGHLDVIIGTNRDQDLLRALDVIDALGKIPVVVVSLPHRNDELAVKQFSADIRKMAKSLEKMAKRPIDEGFLRGSTVAHDRCRSLLERVYQFRKRTVPPLAGGDFLRLTQASMAMPVEEFCDDLEQVLPYLERREARIPNASQRIMVSGDMLDDASYIDLIERCGCLVAMDDLDTGSRYFWNREVADVDEDPFTVLARRYLKKPASPHFCTWNEQVADALRWAHEYSIDGVLELPLLNDHPRLMRSPYFIDSLRHSGVPALSIPRDYRLSNEGQIMTRVGAFLEMLGDRTLRRAGDNHGGGAETR